MASKLGQEQPGGWRPPLVEQARCHPLKRSWFTVSAVSAGLGEDTTRREPPKITQAASRAGPNPPAGQCQAAAPSLPLLAARMCAESQDQSWSSSRGWLQGPRVERRFGLAALQTLSPSWDCARVHVTLEHRVHGTVRSQTRTPSFLLQLLFLPPPVTCALHISPSLSSPTL